MIVDELKAMNAPAKIIEAGEIVQSAIDAGLRPPKDVLDFLRRWQFEQNRNNRYGK